MACKIANSTQSLRFGDFTVPYFWTKDNAFHTKPAIIETTVLKPATNVITSNTCDKQVIVTEPPFKQASEQNPWVYDPMSKVKVTYDKFNKSMIVEKQDGSFHTETRTEEQMNAYLQLLSENAQAEEEFQKADPSKIFKISIGGGKMATESVAESTIKKPLHTTPSMKNKIFFKPIYLENCQILQICHALGNIARKTGAEIEVIDKTAVKGVFKHTIKGKFLQLGVKHLRGEYTPFDIAVSHEQIKIINHVAKVVTSRAMLTADDIKPGTSGFVLHKHNLRVPAESVHGDIFIVQGMMDDVLVDARVYRNHRTRKLIQYY
nr:P1 [Euphorbia ringspot virus]